MAKMIKAEVVGLNSFSNRDRTKQFNLVHVNFDDGETTGLCVATLFVSDQDYKEICSQYNTGGCQLDIFRSGNRYDYII